MKQHKNRNIGILGEDQFKTWCSSVGLIAHRPSDDRQGWDFLVEFKNEIDNTRPLDQQTSLKKVFVQIKTTNNRKNYVAGKLSAFKCLVDTDMPAFIVSLDYGGSDSLKSAKLLHIGADQISEILRGVRNHESKGRTDIHRADIHLSLSPAKDINLNGSNIDSLLRSFVSGSFAEYINQKEQIRQTCGFDVGSHTIVFNVLEGAGTSKLVCTKRVFA